MSNINESLQELLELSGAMAAAVVDSSSGMLLASAGSGVNLDLAAAGNTDVVRAKLRTLKSLGMRESIDDMLITVTEQYHIIRPLRVNPEVFVYLVLNRANSNLALARLKVKDIDEKMVL